MATTLQVATPSEQVSAVDAADGRLHRLGELARGEEVGGDLAEVEVALVDPGLLDGRHDLARRELQTVCEYWR